MISSIFKRVIGSPSPFLAQTQFIGNAFIVSFLGKDSDIYWLPVRLFTGGLVTEEHASGKLPSTGASMFLRVG